MTNLDDLKDAMATPPDFTAQPIDLLAVMAAGGRVRRRRRLAVGSASGVAVLALLVGGAQLAGRGTPTAGGAPAQVAAQPAAPGVLGDIIHTDVFTGGVEWLLYAKAVDEKALPDSHFGVMLGRPAADGTVIDDVMANEVKGSDRAPGFHAVQGAMEVNGRQTPTFGYYVGPAKKITAKAHGKSLTAGMATWSEDPSVQIFWFAPSTGGTEKLTALDKDGKRLPAGDNSVGVG